MRVLAAQYVKWANKTDLDDFWTDPKVKRLYKNHIYAMTSRTNVYNGERPRPFCPPVVGAHQGFGTRLNLRPITTSCGVSTLGWRAEQAADTAASDRYAAARATEEAALGREVFSCCLNWI